MIFGPSGKKLWGNWGNECSPKELWLLLFRASSLCAMPPAAARGHVSMESAGRDIPKFSGDAYQFRQVSV